MAAIEAVVKAFILIYILIIVACVFSIASIFNIFLVMANIAFIINWEINPFLNLSIPYLNIIKNGYHLSRLNLINFKWDNQYLN